MARGQFQPAFCPEYPPQEVWDAHLSAKRQMIQQVNRISNLSPGALNFWRVGLLLIILPGVVLVSGVGVYFARRD